MLRKASPGSGLPSWPPPRPASGTGRGEPAPGRLAVPVRHRLQHPDDQDPRAGAIDRRSNGPARGAAAVRISRLPARRRARAPGCRRGAASPVGRKQRRRRVRPRDAQAIEAALVDGRTSDAYVPFNGRTLRSSMRPASSSAARSRRGTGWVAPRPPGLRRSGQPCDRRRGHVPASRSPSRPGMVLALLGPGLAQSGRTAKPSTPSSSAPRSPLRPNMARTSGPPCGRRSRSRTPSVARSSHHLVRRLTMGMLDRGEITLNAMDAELAAGWFAGTHRGASPGRSPELALRDGAAAKPAELLRSLPGILRTGAGRAPGSARIRHGELTRPRGRSPGPGRSRPARIPRSRRPCSSARRRPRSTSRTSRASWAWRRASRSLSAHVGLGLLEERGVGALLVPFLSRLACPPATAGRPGSYRSSPWRTQGRLEGLR